MADRCPQCNAEYSSDDAYCPVCGTPRRGSAARGEATESDAAATWGGRPAAAGGESEPNEEDDFIPLVFPPEPRRSWATGGGRRSLAVIAIGLAVLGLLAAGAWLVIASGDDDDDGTLDRPDVPVWVVDGSPRVATPGEAHRTGATPDAHDVAYDNTSTGMLPATPTPPMIAPPASNPVTPSTGPSTPVEPGLPLPGAGASPTVRSSSNASFAATPTPNTTAAPSQTPPPTAVATPTATSTLVPTTPPTATAVATATPSATIGLTATAVVPTTPSPTPDATATPTELSIPASVFPNTVAGVLESIVAGIEPPATEVAPTAPAPATTAPPVPPGDGTGGALPLT